MKTYEYFINLDERGYFNADVRDPDTGETIFEIVDIEHANELIEDGFLSTVHDAAEIGDYLDELGIINEEDIVIEGN
jgi:hypothetical protein